MVWGAMSVLKAHESKTQPIILDVPSYYPSRAGQRIKIHAMLYTNLGPSLIFQEEATDESHDGQPQDFGREVV